MQVYKAFFKILQKNLNQIMIYVVVFISLAVSLANTNSKTMSTNLVEAKVKLAFINQDTDSTLVKGLKEYLNTKADMVNLPDEPKNLQDALFFREVEYIIRVPKGFTEGLISGNTVQLEKTTVPGSASEIFMDNLINKYLNTAKTYTSTMKDLSEDELLSYVNKDLSQKTEVKVKHSTEETANNEKRAYYFNYMAYALFSILILGVSSVMIVFNNTDLKKRNLCSPVKLRSMNFQLILGNISYAVFAWFAMVLTSFILYGSFMFTARGLLFLLNSLIFSLAALSISFLIGNTMKTRNAISAASNVVSLGTSFISGVFVPQAFLSKSVIRIASFTPNYWYVKANNSIASMSSLTMENLTPIFFNMLIVLGFAAAVLAVTLVIIKQKRLSS